MIYKLVNKTTQEEHICLKVVIDGFDYYVNDKIKVNDWCLLDNNVGMSIGYKIKQCLELDVLNGEYTFQEGDGDLFTTGRCQVLLATSNLEVDLPKIINEVEELAEHSSEIQEATYTLQHKITYKHGFIDGYLKSQETQSFSKEDMIEFGIWLLTNHELTDSYDDLLELWKEKQIKIIYYD